MSVYHLLGYLAAACFMAWGLRRASELFVVSVEAGRVRGRRGRAPHRLMADLADVVARPPARVAVVRVVSDNGRPAVRARGDLSPEQKQRLRNVVGQWSVAQIRAGDRVA